MSYGHHFNRQRMQGVSGVVEPPDYWANEPYARYFCKQAAQNDFGLLSGHHLAQTLVNTEPDVPGIQRPASFTVSPVCSARIIFSTMRLARTAAVSVPNNSGCSAQKSVPAIRL